MAALLRSHAKRKDHNDACAPHCSLVSRFFSSLLFLLVSFFSSHVSSNLSSSPFLLHVTYFQHVCTVMMISFSLLFRAQSTDRRPSFVRVRQQQSRHKRMLDNVCVRNHAMWRLADTSNIDFRTLSPIKQGSLALVARQTFETSMARNRELHFVRM